MSEPRAKHEAATSITIEDVLICLLSCTYVSGLLNGTAPVAHRPFACDHGTSGARRCLSRTAKMSKSAAFPWSVA
jgi:hypothetical protein